MVTKRPGQKHKTTTTINQSHDKHESNKSHGHQLHVVLGNTGGWERLQNMQSELPSDRRIISEVVDV
ncbi:hypothetical protein V6N12_005483 [Hibiscus sabdariffa]|uniref:Uncharacterized protein n=1 Tax=Hibiscus sabdariffa TaxID=183260 RepID=A0ABR2B6H3_9ROSI